MKKMTRFSLAMTLALCAGLLLCLAAGAQAGAKAKAKGEAKTYECVRPDKTVVCTVTTAATDPDVVCNHDCKSCNLVCVAVLKIVRQGKEVTGESPAGGGVTPYSGSPAKDAGGVIEKSIAQ